jgi:mRNA interferase MazF
MPMRRSEIWQINLDPTVGAEIKKVRPVVIVSTNDAGALPLKVVAPFTGWKPHYADVPWMVSVLPTAQNGLEKHSVCDAFQIRSVSVDRFVRKLGTLEPKSMQAISLSLVDVLGIE